MAGHCLGRRLAATALLVTALAWNLAPACGAPMQAARRPPPGRGSGQVFVNAPLLLDPLYTDMFTYYYSASPTLVNTKTGSLLDMQAAKNMTEYLGIDKDLDILKVQQEFIDFVEVDLGIKFADFGVDWSTTPWWMGQIKGVNKTKTQPNPFGLPDIITGFWIIKPDANMRTLVTTFKEFNDARCRYRPTWGIGYALVPLVPINANGRMYRGPVSQAVEGYVQKAYQVLDCVETLQPYKIRARLIVDLINQQFPSFQGTKAGLVPTSYDIKGTLRDHEGNVRNLTGYGFGVTRQLFDQFGLLGRFFHTTIFFNNTRDTSRAPGTEYLDGLPPFVNPGAGDPNILVTAIVEASG